MTNIAKTWFIITKEGMDNFVSFCDWLNSYNNGNNDDNKIKFVFNPRNCYTFRNNDIEVITTEDTIKLIQEELKDHVETVLTEEEWMKKNEEFENSIDLDFEVKVRIN